MTARADIRRWVRPLLEWRPDLVLVRDRLLVPPFQHVMRGFSFWPALNVDLAQIGWFMVPLVVPSESKGFRLWNDIPFLQHTRPEFQGELEARVQHTIAAYLDGTETLAGMRDYAILDRERHEGGFGGLTLDIYPLEYGVVLAALGELQDAETVLGTAIEKTDREEGEKLDWAQNYLAEHPRSRVAKNNIESANYHLARVDRLRPLIRLLEARDRAGIATLLHRWEYENVVKWEIEHLWEQTPFPVEVVEG